MSVRYFFVLSILGLLLFPSFCQAQGESAMFKARVVEVIDQQTSARDDGSTSVLQKLKLKGLEGKWNDKEFEFDGTRYDSVSANVYEVGDRVMVAQEIDFEGREVFYITDYVRQGSLYWLALVFAVVVIAIGRLKGLRALVVLALTFIIILWFIIPQILNGHSPLLISIIGSTFILLLAIYLTEGFKRTSTIAVVSIIISLIITGLLSIWFTSLTKLSGFASDEAIYLIGLGQNALNIKGLLLAGIIIGALGVLDDIAISQTVLVRELKIANPQLSRRQLYKKAMTVGISHMSSMVNTLFLAYAGAALPLLILFSINEPPFMTFGQVLNNEVIATEIVRTLTGSIGLMLAVPITTLLAVRFIQNEKKPEPPQQALFHQQH